jgi:aromatic ring-opening dioxygenase LigB subunit
MVHFFVMRERNINHKKTSKIKLDFGSFVFLWVIRARAVVACDQIILKKIRFIKYYNFNFNNWINVFLKYIL